MLIFRRQTVPLLSCLFFIQWTPSYGNAEDNPVSSAKATSSTKSGYKNDGTLEGPDGVASELSQDDIDTGAVFTPPILDGTIQPWFDLKREWNEKYGLQLGFSYNALYQGASETSTLEDAAAGGRFQGQGMWTLLGRKTKNPGMVSFRVEDRHRLGTDIPPTKLGSQFGSANVTGGGFSDFEFALTELAWRQTILDGKMKFGFGKISAVSWYNTYALSSALTGFQNLALQSSATKPAVGRGLGAVAGFRLGENFALLTGIHDANGVTSGNPFDTIDETNFYYSAELRWFPTTFDRRKWDQVRLQAWYVDESHQGATPSGYGASLAASRLYKDRYMPFLLAGFSDGGASIIKTDVTAGIAFAFNTKHRAARDVLGMSVNWGSPFDNALNEQVTSELFYRFQLFKNLAFTPSVQYIADPSYNATEDSVWLAGIRGRMTF
jgi:hypothetical protein